MLKTVTEQNRIEFGGPTMGCRWSVLLDHAAPITVPALRRVLQQAVEGVDALMSTQKPDSDLRRLNATPCNTWVAVPGRSMVALAAALAIIRSTGGAFEPNVGPPVRASGFGPDQIALDAKRAASAAPRSPALSALAHDTERGWVRKAAPLALDLSGIAKGNGVDRLAKVLAEADAGHPAIHAICTIAGEIRVIGPQSGDSTWAVSVEMPDTPNRQSYFMLVLADGAVTTSGDYRHFVTVAGQRLSHTVDPRRGAPLIGGPASVSVLAPSCMAADGLATGLMVMGEAAGLAFARAMGISAVFISRDLSGAMQSAGTGHFAGNRS